MRISLQIVLRMLIRFDLICSGKLVQIGTSLHFLLLALCCASQTKYRNIDPPRQERNTINIHTIVHVQPLQSVEEEKAD